MQIELFQIEDKPKNNKKWDKLALSLESELLHSKKFYIKKLKNDK